MSTSTSLEKFRNNYGESRSLLHLIIRSGVTGWSLYLTGLWRIITGSETPSRRPTPASEQPQLSSATASSSQNTRSSSSVDKVQVAFGVAYEIADTQYQNRCDLAASFIYASLTEEARQHLGSFKEQCEMWRILKIDSATSFFTTRIYTAFLNDKMGDPETISAYIASLLGYQTELTGTRRVISDQDFVEHLLTFLSPKFHNMRCFIWDHPKAYQTLDLRNTLLDHEAQVSLETPAVETTALATSAPKSKRQSGRQGQNRNHQRDHDWKDRKDMTCYHCLRKGHYEADCKLKKKCEEFRR